MAHRGTVHHGKAGVSFHEEGFPLQDKIQKDTGIVEESFKFVLPTPLNVFQQTLGKMRENCVYWSFVLA